MEHVNALSSNCQWTLQNASICPTPVILQNDFKTPVFLNKLLSQILKSMIRTDVILQKE